MAQLFPLNADALLLEDRPTLAGTLAGLPDPWTLLCDRKIGAAGLPVDMVLIHPEIGIALVDTAPRDPAPAISALRAYLEEQRFSQFFPGELPIVPLSLAPEEFDQAGERLAAAFESHPPLSIEDRDWADAVIELLLVPDDLTMAPLAAAAADEPPVPAEPGVWAAADEPPAPVPPPPRIASEPPLPLMVDWPFTEHYRRRDRAGPWMGLAAALALVLLAGAGVAAWQLVGEGDDVAASTLPPPSAVALPLAQPPREAAAAPASPAAQPARPAPPVILAEKPLASPPPAPPAATAIEPLPQPKPRQVAENPAPMEEQAKRQPAEPPAAAAAPALETAAAAPPPPSAPARPEKSPEMAVSAKPASTPAAPQPHHLRPRPPARVATATLPRSPARARVSARPQRNEDAPPLDAADLPPLDESRTPPEPPQRTTVAVREPPPAVAPPPTPVASVVSAPLPLRQIAASGSTSAAARECRPYTADTGLTGRGVHVEGIACRGADGEWRLLSEVPLR